jgi:hypothetical protein
VACPKTNKNGGPCRAQVIASSGCCYFHAPEFAQKRRAAQSRGGQGRRVTQADLPELEFDFSPEKMPRHLALVADMMWQGRLDAKTGHAICHAAYVALRAHELGAQKSQSDRIEQLYLAEKNRPVSQSEIDDLFDFEADRLAEIASLENRVARKPPDSETKRDRLEGGLHGEEPRFDRIDRGSEPKSD